MDGDVITMLESKISGLEEKLNLAGNFGNGLLQEIDNLKKKLRTCNSKVEALGQENHSLRVANSLLENSNKHLHNDVETYNKQINTKSSLLESEHDKIVSNYRRQIQDYEKELNDLKTELNSRNELIKEMEKQKASLKTGHEETLSMKVIQLEQLLQDVQQMHSKSLEDKKQLQEELQLKDNMLEDFKDSIEEQKQQIESLKKHLLEKDEQMASSQESLMFTKSELSELQGELQMVRTNVDQVDLEKRGNSLFSEVDDRRLKLESAFVQLKRKCEILKKQEKEHKQNFTKLQTKLASLQLALSRKVSSNVMEQLEKDLAKANTEIKLLLATKLNAECVSPANASPGVLFSPAVLDKAADAEYRVLRLLLHESKNREAELEKEIRDMWSERVNGREQRTEYRRRIIALEQETESQKSEIIKMKTIIEQLQSDYKENKTSEKDVETELNIECVGAELVGNLKGTNTNNSRNTLKSKKVVNDCQQQ